ncbi:MAG: sugar ABC transporter permease [Chloroflexi bacterium]|nr:sugar ABC transporter permease [Chloroflexota bacterium]
MSQTADATALPSINRAHPRYVHRQRLHLLPYLLVLPIILYEGVMMLYPIAQGFWASFSRIELASNRPSTWIGLANYERMLADPQFWNSMRVTVTFTVAVIIIALGAGLFTAMLFNRPFRGRPVARAALMLPWAFPEVPVVMLFIWIVSPQFGVINLLVRWIPGVTQNPQWLQIPTLAMGVVVLVAAWKAFPFYSLVLLAALQSVPQELYEAAKVDGASAVGLFWNITVPGIRSTLELLIVLASIFSFKQFNIIYLMTGGGPSLATETIVMRIYNTAFRFYDYSYGATMAVAGFLASLAIAVVFIIVQARRAQEYA